MSIETSVAEEEEEAADERVDADEEEIAVVPVPEDASVDTPSRDIDVSVSTLLEGSPLF
jgi:hypothetical protein